MYCRYRARRIPRLRALRPQLTALCDYLLTRSGPVDASPHLNLGSSSGFTYSMFQGPIDVSWTTVSPRVVA